ncbi:MAG: hypothetical protein RBT34_04040 [Anaerolineaceae bacterium]|nr:hypothetical protein [Anaerolineaceae bacterium]
MSRVINPETAGKQRKQLARSVVLSIRELSKQTEVTMISKDMAAYIVLALREIHDTVETSVVAWEKRGYWVKADRFRLEWEWSQTLSDKLYQALMTDDWAAMAMLLAQIAQKLNKEQIPARHRMGTPWVGAWKLLQTQGKQV